MWKDLIESLEINCEFRPPASSADLETAEKALGISLPPSLRGLFIETNGVYSPSIYLDIVWNVGELIRRNQSMREDENLAASYMTFESLLFFADAGVDGILFAFPISATRIVQEQNIIAWYPIEDSRPVLAYGLQDYLKRWLTGNLHV
jgi:hypothetical protein